MRDQATNTAGKLLAFIVFHGFMIMLSLGIVGGVIRAFKWMMGAL